MNTNKEEDRKRPDRRDDLVPRERAEEKANRHEHHSERRRPRLNEIKAPGSK